MSDIHPTVQAAAQAMSRHATSNGYRLREERTPLASTAVAAAFRERAEHVTSGCAHRQVYYMSSDRLYRGRRITTPCPQCTEFAKTLNGWADEIEGASSE